MQAGRLNRRCVLQTPNTETDEIGQPIPGWTDVAQVWGNIHHLNGSEAIKAGAVTSTVSASIRIRYRTDLNASMRVLVGATAYAIRAVLPDMQRREFVDLIAEAN